MRARVAALALLLAACSSSTPELELTIRLPTDKKLLAAVTQLKLTAVRENVVLSQQSFSPTATYLSLTGVSHGASTVITLDGIDSAGDVIARGRTCPVDFQAAGTAAGLYFAPTNFFAPTVGAPLIMRVRPTALALSDGSVLVAGGSDGTSVVASAEVFAAGSATFTASSAALNQPRQRAEAASLSSGQLIVGGVNAAGAPIAAGELYPESLKQFLAVTGLDARVGHRVVVLPDGRAFISGGLGSGGTPLATTQFVSVKDDGTYQVASGPPLAEARSEQAAIVAIGIPMVFGGYDAAGKPLDSIEAIDPANITGVAAPAIAHLTTARAEATASLLSDGSILLVGGVGSDGQPIKNAELYNPITQKTKTYAMAAARHAHSATVLGDGRILVAGGLDAGGQPIASVELFVKDVGFLTERALGTARADHVAVPLCDGTVLILGGGAGAEIYSGPATTSP